MAIQKLYKAVKSDETIKINKKNVLLYWFPLNVNIYFS